MQKHGMEKLLEQFTKGIHKCLDQDFTIMEGRIHIVNLP